VSDDILKKHRRHMADVPDDFLETKLAMLGVDREEFGKIPSIVIEAPRRKERTITITPKSVKPARLIDVKAHTRSVKPQTLDELKELAGTPNRLLEGRPERLEWVGRVDRKRLQKVSGRKLDRLDFADKKLAFGAARELLHGYADPTVLERPEWQWVVKTMLDLASRLTVFLAPDLIVGAGQSVSFTAYGTFYFNNVIVYGNGGIRLGGQAKLHAYRINHV
jgi:hypothetical protein